MNRTVRRLAASLILPLFLVACGNVKNTPRGTDRTQNQELKRPRKLPNREAAAKRPRAGQSSSTAKTSKRSVSSKAAS